MTEDYFMRGKEAGGGSYHIGGIAMVHSEDAGTGTPESICLAYLRNHPTKHPHSSEHSRIALRQK